MSNTADARLTLEDVRNQAKQKLKGFCNVYKECDGDPARFCQGHQYGRALGMGGIGSGASFRNNWLALQRVRLNMRLSAPHFTPDTSFTFFGRALTMPIMAASISGVNSFGGESVMTEQAFCEAVVDGCNAAGTLAWRGDTYSYAPDCAYGIDAIHAGGQGGVKIVKPRKQRVILDFFKRAEDAGITAVGVDVDGCSSPNMAQYKQGVERKSADDIRELVDGTSLPFIAKGIMCPEDAVTFADAGVAALVVSNHGGRALDHTPGSADVLPDIVSALSGRDVMVLADGGIRGGADVVKMLALGADAVLVGRDIVRAAVGGAAEGVQLQMDYLQKMMARAMLMTGCRDLAAITADVIQR